MLNRVALIAQIQKVSDSLFSDFSQEHDIARLVWNEIANDPTFIYKVQGAQSRLPWQVPLWTDKLDKAIEIDQKQSSYLGLSVDGSQIYPDRHQGTGSFLVNIGSVALGYGIPNSPVYFNSIPYVFSGDQQNAEIGATPDYVNCLRQEFEFQGGLDLVSQYSNIVNAHPTVFLFDGSLIFWHLASKQEELKELFLKKYINLLNQWHEAHVLLAGYISLPKSKELVSLIRCALSNFDPKNSDAHKSVEHLVDASIVRFFLKPGMRTIIFKSMSAICSEYPPHAHPHFFYMDVGTEVVRIEVPWWIAQSDESVNTIARVVLDQTSKGFGYPVLIAEAHEQAVVKGPDRDFFYHLIAKLAIERNRKPILSAKSMKKKGIGI